MNRETISGFGIGLGVGIITGAVLALLFAPQSGEETRGLIKSKAEDVAATVRGKLGRGKLEDIKPT